LLDGKPVLQHSIERLAAGFPLTMTYVALAVGDRWYDRRIGVRDRVAALRCGGNTRAETVRNALAAIGGAASDDWVVVHDAARPCVDAASLARLQRELVDDDIGGILAVPVVSALKRADGYGRSLSTEPRGGLLAIPLADTLKREDQADRRRVLRTEDRAGLWQAQTPQMFRYGVLRDALARPGAELAVDEAQAVEAMGHKPRLIAGNSTNLKISYPEDLVLAAAILSAERGAKS
jgi:2-C-methyl-D-erythritol 4-phosphate cytidylyltransferase